MITYHIFCGDINLALWWCILATVYDIIMSANRRLHCKANTSSNEVRLANANINHHLGQVAVKYTYVSQIQEKCL